MAARHRGRRLVTAALGLAAAWLVVACGGGGADLSPFQPAAEGDPGADVVSLVRVAGNQYLVPVQVGNQTFRLLLDTGFMGVMVFADLLDPGNRLVEVGNQVASLHFGSGLRRGRFATAPIRVGTHVGANVRIAVIEDPVSTADESMAWRGAQGILGLRFKPGAGTTSGRQLDPLLLRLTPTVRAVEFDLGAAQPTVTFGGTPEMDGVAAPSVFSAQTTTELRDDRVNESYADLEVPFQVSSTAGSAATPGLRALLDTGAVSGLVLDRGVALQIGWSPETGQWSIPPTEELLFQLVGSPAPLTLRPRAQRQEVVVADLSRSSFDAVVGVRHWEPFVVAFDFVDWTLGGPYGTFRFLDRATAAPAPSWPTDRYVALPGLNSSATDVAPGLSGDGQVVVFNSDRAGGRGRTDIYCYRRGQGLVDLPGLNSPYNDEAPAVSENGNLIAFTSNRPGGQGGWDIWLYDVAQQQFVDLPGLNSAYLERTSSVSPDGRYVTFRSERRPGDDTTSDLFVYDRQTQALLPTPGLNGDWNGWTSRLTRDGRLLLVDAEQRAGDQGLDDVHLYDLVAQREVPLSRDVNSAADDLFVTMTSDGSLIGLQTTRWGANTAAGTDVALFDLTRSGSDGLPGVLVSTPGLNLPGYEDSSPVLSGDGRFVAFTSVRPRGLGGSDIYLYELP